MMAQLGFLLLSFYLVFPSAPATAEGDLEHIAAVLMEDRKLVRKIIFETLFHQIVQRGLLLKALAGEKSKEEMVDTWRSTKEDTWACGRAVIYKRIAAGTPMSLCLHHLIQVVDIKLYI